MTGIQRIHGDNWIDPWARAFVCNWISQNGCGGLPVISSTENPMHFSLVAGTPRVLRLESSPLRLIDEGPGPKIKRESRPVAYFQTRKT